MRISKHVIVSGLSILFIGSVVLFPYLFPLFTQLASAKVQPVAVMNVDVSKDLDSSVIQGDPRRIVIPSLGIDVAIKDGEFDTAVQQWTIDEESAFYATPTMPINNDNGSTLIYGHNSGAIFGKLPKLESGAEAIVSTDSGYVFTYVYKDSEIVDPANVSVLQYSGSPRIMLQTCTGFWNEHRQMFYFYLSKYEKE